MVNQVTLIGRLGSQAELRETSAGPVVSFSMATSKKWTKDGEKHEKTEWHRVVWWGGKAAPILIDSLSKGVLVYVLGELQTRKYADKSGVEKYTTEVVVQTLRILEGNRYRDSGKAAEGRDPSPEPGADDPTQPSFSEDDIPF
jgi:single-strand DNA-binding protein